MRILNVLFLLLSIKAMAIQVEEFPYSREFDLEAYSGECPKSITVIHYDLFKMVTGPEVYFKVKFQTKDFVLPGSSQLYINYSVIVYESQLNSQYLNCDAFVDLSTHSMDRKVEFFNGKLTIMVSEKEGFDPVKGHEEILEPITLREDELIYKGFLENEKYIGMSYLLLSERAKFFMPH